MNRNNSSLDWVLSHWAHFTVLRFIFVYVLFCVWLYIACTCNIVTWWGGIEAYPYDRYVPQCFDTVGWVTWPVKPVPDMTYNVFSGMLNPTQSRRRRSTVLKLFYLTSGSVMKWNKIGLNLENGRSSGARSVSRLPPAAWWRLQAVPGDYTRQMLRLAATTASWIFQHKKRKGKGFPILDTELIPVYRQSARRWP